MVIKLRRKCNEQFLREMKENHPALLVLSEYRNGRTKVNLKCQVCGYEFSATPGSLYMGHGCPSCAGNARKTTKQFIEEMNQINPNIQIIGKYVNNKYLIRVKCKTCGREWTPTPNSLLEHRGCQKCSGLMKKTQEEFIEQMRIKHPTIKVVGNYVNNRTKVRCFCDVCEKYFDGTPHAMLDGGNGCPLCTTSRGENKIKQWLNKHDFLYNQQYSFADCVDVRVLPFDFYLPENNVAIEYDGVQHFKQNDYFGGQDSFNILIKHDKIKSNYCKDNNIKLIRIPYFEFDNIENILEFELAS